MVEAQKEVINVALIGHKGHGKSTLAGQLLYLFGPDRSAAKRQLEENKETLKKYNFYGHEKKFAWLLDTRKAERILKCTVDVKYKMIQIDDRQYRLIDTPGDVRYITNALVGYSQADAAILVVSAADYDRGMEAHQWSSAREIDQNRLIGGQIREHALMAQAMGVKQLVVAITSLDRLSPMPIKENGQKSEDLQTSQFKRIRYDLSNGLKKIGYKITDQNLVIVNAYTGSNVCKREEGVRAHAHLWKDFYRGVSLEEALAALRVPKRPIKKPLRVPCDTSYRIGGVGTVICGSVQTGHLVNHYGKKYSIAPCPDRIIESKSLEINYKSASEAGPGEQISLAIRNFDGKQLHRGCVLSDPNNDPCREAKMFIAQILVMSHPTVIKRGYLPLVHCHTAAVIEEAPDSLRAGDAALVELCPEDPLIVEKFSDYPPLGRFVMRDSNVTVAIGIVKDVFKFPLGKGSVKRRSSN